jgi:hypothetical protein
VTLQLQGQRYTASLRFQNRAAPVLESIRGVSPEARDLCILLVRSSSVLSIPSLHVLLADPNLLPPLFG